MKQANSQFNWYEKYLARYYVKLADQQRKGRSFSELDNFLTELRELVEENKAAKGSEPAVMNG